MMKARKTGLLATTFHTRDEVRTTTDVLTLIHTASLAKKMIAIAEQIIAQKEGAFAPEEFTDGYEDAR